MNDAKDKELLLRYAKINNYQLERILQFWKLRTKDDTYGGFITNFDEVGEITSFEKNIWMNARQTWLFSTIAVGSGDLTLLDLAASGYDFITRHAYAENGEWYFLLERDGSPLVTDRSVLTDMFCLMGLGAYEGARGLNPSRYFLETVSALTSKLLYSQEMSIYPQRVDLDVIAHSPFMIAVNAFSEVRSQLGDGEADVVIKYCISKIYENLYSHERGLVYESRNVISGNNIPDESAIINPGHIFESMAFIVKESKRLDMMQEYNLSLDAIQKAFEVSSDNSYGGILHMLHMDGSIGKYTDWHVERNLQSTDKVWWTHAEALYALLLLYYERRNPEVLKNFTSLFDWCEKHFWDDTVGEWNMILEQNGNKKLCLKGGLQKAAFHVPRSLYNMQALFKLLIMEIR